MSYDITFIHAYTFEDCINACSMFNTEPSGHNNLTCAGVSYVKERYGWLQTPDYGNCFLKASVPNGDFGTAEAGTDSARWSG